jgi:ABC-type branched-subunit amino acid transport system ATPase component
MMTPSRSLRPQLHQKVTTLVEVTQDYEPEPSAEVLAVDNVDFAYGRVQVLFSVSLSVREGEALALLGTNGAGKSTLLRVIAGLGRPSAGRIVFAGQEITGAPAERLPGRGLVLVSGGRAVFTDLTVSENLDVQGLPLRKHRSWLRERRAYVYDMFPTLAERSSQPAGSLSGGEQQQLALAKAVLLDPKLLCIDELSLGLAPVVVEELMATVRSIQECGVAVILVEQSLNIAAEMCEYAVFMEKGEVRFEGPSQDLLERDDIARAVFLGQS